MMRVIMALALLGGVALAQPAEPLLDYRLLCNGTSGCGDSDDFCRLWAQSNFLDWARTELDVDWPPPAFSEACIQWDAEYRRGRCWNQQSPFPLDT